MILRETGAGVSLGRGSFPITALRDLVAADLAAPQIGSRGRDRCVITEAGRAHQRRAAQADPAGAFGSQHRDLVEVEIVGTSGSDRVSLNAAESPLAWLRRRRDRNGEPLIDAAAFEAGERLRRDITFAGMLPSVTARWDGAVGRGEGGLRDPGGATDAAIAARQRVRQALDAVGPDMADVLVDLCGFLKGLELIERERNWPPRSAKVVARLALHQLARHYGLDAEARGPGTSRGILAWEAPDRGDP